MSGINNHIQGIREGNEESFSALYELLEKPLFNHLYKMLGSLSLAEETFQEVMVAIIEKIDTYSHREDLQNSFKAWVFRIATNLAIDEIRKNKRSSLLQEDVTLTSNHVQKVSSSHPAEIQDTKERINFHIQRLPLIQRTFLNLKINEQMTLKEISVICKCEVNAVKQGLFRARKSMKTILLQEGIGL
jgi:RNA polymerase sigma-70 factor (ECF subfamily)